jgi:cytochrome P450
LIDEFQGLGSCNFTAQYAQLLPIRIFLTLYGLPVEDGPRLKAFADQITRPDGTMTVMDAVRHLTEYLAGPVAARRREPRDDVLSCIVNGEVDGVRLTEEQALAVTPQVLIAGLDTVVNFLNFAMLHLARNPQQRRALAREPQLIPAAAKELLRRYPLVVAARMIGHDVVLDGAQLREGDMVVLPTLLHGLDERVNVCPMDVDLHRVVDDDHHSTFGRGPHHCPGSYLARAELRITLETWLRRIPEFEVAPHSEIAYRGGVVPAIAALPLVWDRTCSSS